MTYIDPSGDLPWYMRQGGAGPTGGPSGAPQGGSGGGAKWLQYLQQMMLGQGQDQDMPSPNAQPVSMVSLDGGGDFQPPPAPPAPPAAPAAPNQFQTGGPELAAAMARAAQQRPPPAPPAGPAFPARPAGVSASGLPLQPGSLSPAALAQFGRGAGGPIGSGGYVPTPSGGGSFVDPNVPAPNAQPVSGALANPAANQRFVQIDRPNAPAGGGGGMARGGPPQMSALNLAGLFGGGQPAVNPNAPAANAQPVSAVRPVAGPLARPAPSAPLAANAPMPPVKPGDIASQQVANALKNKKWLQNL